MGAEVVDVRDAARALTLAGERGRVGERYIVAERFMTSAEIAACACAAVGVAPPARGVPRRARSALAALGEAAAWARGRETRLTRTTVRLMHVMPRMSHAKAVRELGWDPSPAPDAIADGARFFVAQRHARAARDRRPTPWPRPRRNPPPAPHPR